MAAVVPRTLHRGWCRRGGMAGLSSDPFPPCLDPDGAGWCRTGTRRLFCLVLLDRLCINKSCFLLLFFLFLWEKKSEGGVCFRHRPQPTERPQKRTKQKKLQLLCLFCFVFLATADPSWVCNGAGGATSGREEIRKTTRRTSEWEAMAARRRAHYTAFAGFFSTPKAQEPNFELTTKKTVLYQTTFGKNHCFMETIMKTKQFVTSAFADFHEKSQFRPFVMSQGELTPLSG